MPFITMKFLANELKSRCAHLLGSGCLSGTESAQGRKLSSIPAQQHKQISEPIAKGLFYHSAQLLQIWTCSLLRDTIVSASKIGNKIIAILFLSHSPRGFWYLNVPQNCLRQ